MSEVSDRPTVLVVDDEPGLADLYATWLEGDYDAEAVYNGREAIERLARDIDVVMLDRRMPGVSGDEVLEHINDREFDCRVAMLSGIGPNLDLLELEVDGHLTKPVEREEICGLVEDLVQVSGYDEPLQDMHRLARTILSVRQGVSEEELDASEMYIDLHRRLNDLTDGHEDGTVGDVHNDLEDTVGTLLENGPPKDRSSGDATQESVEWSSIGDARTD